MKSTAGRPNGFPEKWQDPLELFECMVDDLAAEGYDLNEERQTLLDLISRYGAEWVWENRHRLLNLSAYFKEYEVRAGDAS